MFRRDAVHQLHPIIQRVRQHHPPLPRQSLPRHLAPRRRRQPRRQSRLHRRHQFLAVGDQYGGSQRIMLRLGD